jgi:hypothetical protein
MANNKIKSGHLKQHLKQLSKDELINDIVELHSKIDLVKDYYQTKLFPDDESQVVEKYKVVVKNEFFPTRGFGKLRLAEAKKAISDYKKICRNQASLVDLMLFYVEMGVKFINSYGDIKESFYSSGETMYEGAIKLIVENKMQEMFEERCRRIVNGSSDAGYGFHDQLRYIYRSYFSPQTHA